MYDELKSEITKEFKMIDTSLVSSYLGIKVKQSEEILMSEKGYGGEMLKSFNMDGANPVGTSMECGVKITKQIGERR